MESQDLADAIADVAEGFCPLCHVALITHDGRACCPCGGVLLPAGTPEVRDDHLRATPGGHVRALAGGVERGADVTPSQGKPVAVLTGRGIVAGAFTEPLFRPLCRSKC
jgi:hypothetical protein